MNLAAASAHETSAGSNFTFYFSPLILGKRNCQKQMMRKSTLIKITLKHLLHLTAVPMLNPAQPLYNGIRSLEGFPRSAQTGELKLIPTMLYSSHADYGQKLYRDLFNKQVAEMRKIITSSPEHTSMVFTELNISNCCACTKLRTYPS